MLITLFLVNRYIFKQRRLFLKASIKRTQLKKMELTWGLCELSGKCYVWSTDRDNQASWGPWINLILMNDQFGKYYLHYYTSRLCSIHV